jgi:hypothetical protein
MKKKNRYIVVRHIPNTIPLYWSGYVWTDNIREALPYASLAEAEFKRKQFRNAQVRKL